MDIICKQCNTTSSIPAPKLPKENAGITCKRCGYKIIIHAAGAEKARPPQAHTPPPAPSKVPVAQHHGKDVLNVFPEMSDFDGSHYDLDELLKPNHKGRYNTGFNKYKVKILATVKPTLDRLLGADELVMHVAGGTAYYPIEIFMGNGILTMLYNRYALVATNRRLVMINTNTRMTRTSHLLFQMTYDEIKKVSRGLFRTSLVLTPKNGNRRTFTSMKRAFTKELHDFIKSRMDPLKTMAAEAESKPHLCPACFSPLTAKLVQCPSCQTGFKTTTAAALRSLILPGLGDLYLGHRFLGCCELLGALLVWFFALGMFMTGSVPIIAMAAVLLLFFNGFDALLTFHMAKKGYLPAKPVAAPHPKPATSSA
jgi:DNA-directed RNA polymerase subunit RPC12/RpoP